MAGLIFVVLGICVTIALLTLTGALFVVLAHGCNVIPIGLPARGGGRLPARRTKTGPGAIDSWTTLEGGERSCRRIPLRPGPGGVLRHWPVGQSVGNVRNQGQKLTEALTSK